MNTGVHLFVVGIFSRFFCDFYISREIQSILNCKHDYVMTSKCIYITWSMTTYLYYLVLRFEYCACILEYVCRIKKFGEITSSPMVFRATECGYVSVCTSQWRRWVRFDWLTFMYRVYDHWTIRIGILNRAVMDDEESNFLNGRRCIHRNHLSGPILMKTPCTKSL